jgi:formylglycine-generating enzyme required for sulfatase activity
MDKLILLSLVAVTLVGSASAQLATTDTFGTGVNQFTIDFTTIGNPGNAADPRHYTGYGKVDYTYRIGTYAISQNQIDKATASGLQNVTAGPWSGDQPAANMTWYESASFVNWLNVSKGFQAAYNLSWSGSTWSMALWTATDAGYDANNLYRNSLAKYFLPSENEFYKAAYGKSDGSGYYLYPTANGNPPAAVASGASAGTAVYGGQGPAPASVYAAGGPSSYGTMGQGGNVHSWQESAYDGLNDDAQENRGFRGGYWGTSAVALQSDTGSVPSSPVNEDSRVGFRVASVETVPEPSTYALFGLGAIGILMVMRRKKAV